MLVRALVLLACTLVAVAPPATARAQPIAVGADYDIPNGHFYTQAAPGQNGAGYRVANEGGIPFWDEFRRQGGLRTLGYPLTTRFQYYERVVQMFQFGTLHWLSETGRTEILPVGLLGEPPASARLVEAQARTIADAAQYPWSGWWWPASSQVSGPRLFDPNGPLAKYDRYVTSLGRPNPRTQQWEEEEVFFAGLQWAGHCNGWAAAALLEPEPKETRVLNGQSFTVADQKGLLTSYHFADAALWGVGGDGRSVTPAEFHRTLTSWLGEERKGLIFTFRLVGEEVWSFPAFKYESVVGPDALHPDVWQVRTVVWLVDNDVPAGFVGGRPWPDAEGKVFEYTLTGDPQNPDGGEWAPETAGRFGRPYMLWYPDPSQRNIDRQLASPSLDYATIDRIIRGPA